MAGLPPEKWRVLSPYLDQALEISPDQRAAWLAGLKEQEPALAAELQVLLREHRALVDEGFLQAGAPAPPKAPSLAGQAVGAYTLESPLGQGGMGSVWLARRSDGRFEGRAAVKFLNLALLGGVAEGRFKREGTFLARLAHPNIAHLVDAGVSGTGQPYLILEHVEGKEIDKYCDAHALDVRARIQLFLDVLAAVAHAHVHLIVHRDLKPSNVLVTHDGQVKLLDFGIAKLLEDEGPSAMATVLTQEGQSALTLAYAAPEQVTDGPITTATDIYSLGVLLYLLLAGKHPAEYALQSSAALIKAIVDSEPPLPSHLVASNKKLSTALRGDLDTIISKALKKNPAERYGSTTAFADDLRRYLRAEPISARPDTLPYRARKFIRRNRVAVVLASVAFIGTIGGAIGTAIQARTARTERDFALRQLSRAEAINELNSFVLSDAAPSGKPFTVNELLARAEQVVARQRGSDDVTRVELLMSIGRQYTVQEEYGKARPLLEQARALASALPEKSTRGRAACALAQTLANQGDSSGAEGLIQEGLQQLGGDSRFALDRVFCLQRGSEVAGRRGEAEEQLHRAQAAERALKQSPLRSELLELDNLIALAAAYRNVGQVRQASEAFQRAVAQLGSLGRDDTQRAGTVLNNWGVALYLWGQPLDSERVLRRAIKLSQDGQSEAATSPMLLLNYARALVELGRLTEAADYAERAHGKAQKGGDKVAVNQSLLVRSSIYRGQGDLERAARMLSEVESTLRPSVPPGHIALASLASLRALLAQARGELQSALELANESVATVEALIKQGREGSSYLPIFLARRAEIQLQLGRREEARSDAARAVKMLETIQPGTFSAHLGRAYLALGRSLSAPGEEEEAHAPFRAAVEQMQSALGPDHAETRSARQLAEK
jgi:serine/threonine-protein kinase